VADIVVLKNPRKPSLVAALAMKDLLMRIWAVVSIRQRFVDLDTGCRIDVDRPFIVDRSDSPRQMDGP